MATIVYQTLMDMDRTCSTKISLVNNKNNTAMDPRGRKEERKARDILEMAG
jgi:hypothetical protein